VTQPIPSDGLHPNIARIAAAYDIILEELSSRQISVAAARAKIAQLEARDDDGTRWSIDPDSGQFVRKTALGAEEYDTPPRVGYQTHDAFSYTNPNPHVPRSPGQGPRVEDPNSRLEMFTARMGDSALTTPPAGLVGATRGARPRQRGKGASALSKFWALPAAAKAAAAAAVVVVVVFVTVGLGGSEEPDVPPAPAPAQSPPAK
jgi:hypothetical protein